MSKVVLGLDFGTLSGHALAVDTASGRELASAETAYPHKVMDECLPNGQKLPPDFALQHPGDYPVVMETIIKEALKRSGAAKEDVIGIGLDFTSSTVLPVNGEGVPLCLLPGFEGEPHAYVKLWKHHAAAPYAAKMERAAKERGEGWLKRYGGKVSSEWLFPKLFETLELAPRVYQAAARFMEAGDWLVYQLTGAFSQNACMAGYKAFYDPKSGFPDRAYFAACDIGLENVVQDKLFSPVLSQGRRAGGLSARYAEKLGLLPDIAVAAANVDAHVCLPAVKITRPNKMLMILGTSTCHLMLNAAESEVPGICGSVWEGILPGYYGLEAGQSCVGDLLDWFVRNCVPESRVKEAEKSGMNIHAYLQSLARKQRPGEHGLIALDWWNGNRSVLVNPELTGLVIGQTLKTGPQDIYRALVEATAFGSLKIIENYRKNGVSVEEVCLAGGIAEKSPFIVQVYADVLGLPLRLSGSAQGPALGSAMFAAVAAGPDAGGFRDIRQAAEKMGSLKPKAILPDPKRHAAYLKLYALYEELHDCFGLHNDLMKRLRCVKEENAS